MKSYTILVDLDDVLENFCETWVSCINEKFGTNVAYEDITEWDICKFFPTLKWEELYGVTSHPEFWDKVKPLPHSVEMVKKLIDDGHKVYVVTSTHHNVLKYKMEQVLFKHFPFIKRTNVIVSYNKQMIKGDFLIDDYPKNLKGGDYKRLLMSAPHNKNVNEKDIGAVRVSDWREIYEIISSYARKTKRRKVSA